jgi:5-formyltetrahydrofolate cyclo-ligase
LDIVLLPGVGFDHQMNRIGHGKGYYDHFIQRCHDYAKKVGREPPALGMSFLQTVLRIVALALKEQIVEDGRIPMTDADWKMDIIIADGEIIKPTVH